jgi:hypothetical protein
MRIGPQKTQTVPAIQTLKNPVFLHKTVRFRRKTALSAAWKTLTIVPVAPVPTIDFVVLATRVVTAAFPIQPTGTIPDK